MLRYALAGSGAIAVVLGAAAAQERRPYGPRTYISTSAGGIAFSSGSFEITGPDDLLEVDTREGEQWTGAIGVAEGQARGEIQYAYRRVDIENVSASGVVLPNASGEFEVAGFYANGYFDFVAAGPLSPYVGFGLGGVYVDVEVESGDGVFFQDADTVFSWQAMGGASLRLGSNAEVFGQYTYYATAKTRYNANAVAVTTTGDVVVVTEGGQVPTEDFDIGGHAFAAGVRLRF